MGPHHMGRAGPSDPLQVTTVRPPKGAGPGSEPVARTRAGFRASLRRATHRCHGADGRRTPAPAVRTGCSSARPITMFRMGDTPYST